ADQSRCADSLSPTPADVARHARPLALRVLTLRSVRALRFSEKRSSRVAVKGHSLSPPNRPNSRADRVLFRPPKFPDPSRPAPVVPVSYPASFAALLIADRALDFAWRPRSRRPLKRTPTPTAYVLRFESWVEVAIVEVDFSYAEIECKYRAKRETLIL